MIFRSTPTSRRISRIIFGVLLIAGAARIAARLIAGNPTGSSDETATMFAWTWGAAIAGAVLVRWVLPIRAREGLITASLVVPAIGVALLSPLTVHLVAVMLVDHSARGFDDWVVMSMLYTGLAHVVFVAMTAIRAAQLARGRKAITVGAIYVGSVAAGMVPFPIIPSVIIALTGIPIFPALLYMQRIAERERAEIAVPIAVVQSA
jgi:hypothetical protein